MQNQTPVKGANLLTVPEVARALRVTVTTVRRLVERGDLSAVKVGPKLVRIPRTALTPFIGEEAAQ